MTNEAEIVRLLDAQYARLRHEIESLQPPREVLRAEAALADAQAAARNAWEQWKRAAAENTRQPSHASNETTRAVHQARLVMYASEEQVDKAKVTLDRVRKEFAPVAIEASEDVRRTVTMLIYQASRFQGLLSTSAEHHHYDEPPLPLANQEVWRVHSEIGRGLSANEIIRHVVPQSVAMAGSYPDATTDYPHRAVTDFVDYKADRVAIASDSRVYDDDGAACGLPTKFLACPPCAACCSAAEKSTCLLAPSQPCPYHHKS